MAQMKTDMFPQMNRKLTREEAAVGFDRLKETVAAMEFATDVARLCKDGGIVYQHHKWKVRTCSHCGAKR